MNDYIINNAHFLKRARNIRNELLNKTDKYILSDYPISLERQMIIKTYRQDLRNFINNNEIKILAGEKVEFPTQPDFIDLNILY
jgi:uncharacterized protein YeeX (DUF496 family)